MNDQNFVFIDTFAGLGGASEAFVNHPSWIVQRMDNNPLLSEVPHMTIASFEDFHAELMYEVKRGAKPSRPVHIFWASIPCDEVSLGFSSARSKADRAGEDFTPHRTLKLLDLVLDVIDVLQPQYWVIENVRGALKFFKPVLGEPQQIIAGKYVLWGNFPHIHCDESGIQSKFFKDTWSSDPLRANRRAVVPMEISEGLLKAYHSQRQLWDFC